MQAVWFLWHSLNSNGKPTCSLLDMIKPSFALAKNLSCQPHCTSPSGSLGGDHAFAANPAWMRGRWIHKVWSCTNMRSGAARVDSSCVFVLITCECSDLVSVDLTCVVNYSSFVYSTHIYWVLAMVQMPSLGSGKHKLLFLLWGTLFIMSKVRKWVSQVSV